MKQHVRLQIDTKNGAAPLAKKLGLNRNAVYVLVLDESGREKARLILAFKAPQTKIIAFLKQARHAAAAKGASGVDLLLRLLDDADAGIRYDAAQSLSRLGPNARQATSKLTTLLKDRAGRPSVAWQAAIALKKIGPPAKDALAALTAVLEEPRADVALRQQAAFAMVAIDPKGKTVLPALITALETTKSLVRFGVVIALDNLGPAAKPAEKALRSALPRTSGQVATRIQHVLRNLSGS